MMAWKVGAVAANIIDVNGNGLETESDETSNRQQVQLSIINPKIAMQRGNGKKAIGIVRWQRR